MLFSFTIDPSAISRTSNSPNVNLISRRHHAEAVLQQWSNYGVFYVLSDPDGNGLQDLLKNILNIKDQYIKKIWEEQYKRMRSNRRLQSLRKDQWKGYDDDDLKSKYYRPLHDVDNLDLVGLYEEFKNAKPAFKPEVISYPGFLRSHVLRQAQALESETVRGGSRLQDVWNERFLPYARITRKVLVRDRYGLNDLLDISGKSPAKMNFPVRNFLTFMADSVEQPCEIEFMTLWPSKNNNYNSKKNTLEGNSSDKQLEKLFKQATRDIFNRRREGPGITKIEFHLINFKEFQKDRTRWHERYITFDSLSRIVVADGFDNLFADNDKIAHQNSIFRQKFDPILDNDNFRDFVTYSTTIVCEPRVPPKVIRPNFGN